MLLKNGINLFNQLVDFLHQSTNLHIYVPYIKSDALKALISNQNHIRSVTIRWEPHDLISGASDLEVYPLLNDMGITLYRNSRLHLKAYVDNFERAFVSSANISQRALNFPEMPNYNYELGYIVQKLSFADQLYFQMIEAESIMVTDQIYEELKLQLSDKRKVFPYETDFDFNIDYIDKNFLISALPMSYDITTLANIYLGNGDYNQADITCAAHDLAIYKIPLGLNESDFKKRLKTGFFNHPFIGSFLENLDTTNEIFFGRAKDWIQKNCSNVPTPRKWEITTNIQILYRWIEELSNGVYGVDRPNYSERLFRTT